MLMLDDDALRILVVDLAGAFRDAALYARAAEAAHGRAITALHEAGEAATLAQAKERDARRALIEAIVPDDR